ncbi:MAG TPA: deoxyribose-phosphate aldolase [Beijerinckiaceae bacterium]|jgi:deoxyribose-phosphate aldolase
MSEAALDAVLARRALRCLDLTDLSETCSDPGLDALCRKALTPLGPVAAVCIWPQFVDRARDILKGTSVRIATVVNFPGGDEDIERVVDAAEEAVGDGADEIDCVLPYRAFLAGDARHATDLIAGVRDVVDGGRILKVILETGALGNAQKIEAAARLAIAAGTDFLKTSTGKLPVSATPEAAEAMLAAIRAAGRPVGLKVSGGIRALADAKTYLDLADRVMGEGWATPKTFRIGATQLYDALVAAIEGRG